MTEMTPSRWLMTAVLASTLSLVTACGDSDDTASQDPCRLCDVQVLYQLPCGPLSRADCEMDCQELTAACPALWEDLTKCVVADPQVSCDGNSDLNFEACTSQSQAVNMCADSQANGDADTVGGDGSNSDDVIVEDVGPGSDIGRPGPDTTPGDQDTNGAAPDA